MLESISKLITHTKGHLFNAVRMDYIDTNLRGALVLFLLIMVDLYSVKL